jgi:hypothetical protein
MTEKSDGLGEDLLVANPNHQLERSENESESESE